MDIRKKYKSLSEVYLEKSFAKPVPLIPRQKINEAKIKITFDDGRTKELVTSDYTASKLLGVETKISGNLNESISQWLAAGGWKPESITIILPILTAIIERNLKTNNPGVVKELLEDINIILKLKRSLTNFRNNLVSRIFKGFIQNFPVKLKQLGSERLIDEIEKNCVFAEGGVAVGPGEVLSTLYSEMVNPQTGDLAFPDGKKVELKGSAKPGTGGRPGKKNVVDAANNATKKLAADFAKRRGQLDAETTQELRRLAGEVKDKLQLARGRVTTNIKLFGDIINLILTNPNFNVASILDSISNIDAFGKAGDKLTNTKVGTQIATLLNKYEENREGKEVTTFRSYFNTEKDPQILTDKLLLFSVRPQLIDRNFLLQYVTNIGSKFNSVYAARIVSAMQITDYFVDEKYSYIIFFSSESGKQVVIGEFTNDYMANFKMSLSKASEFTDVKPGTGGTVARGGFSVIV